jgi:hypothetical protein
MEDFGEIKQNIVSKIIQNETVQWTFEKKV